MSRRFQAKATFGPLKTGFKAYNSSYARNKKVAMLRGTSKRNRYVVDSRKLATRGWVNNNTELKYIDVAAASYVMDTTGTVTALNLVAVGDDNTTRDGRQIQIKSCHIRGYVSPVDDITTDGLGRWMLVWDAQPNSGVIATIALILAAATSISGTNLDNRERFTILRDKQFALGKTVNTATQAVSNCPNMYEVNEYVKMDHKSTFSGTTAVIGVVATGALLLVTIGSNAAGACGQLTATSRVRFSDR